MKDQFVSRYIDDITVAEIEDYLLELYYVENRAYSYTKLFLKMFYLIFGQAYSRNYLEVDIYNKLCINKDTKRYMPKQKIDEKTHIVYFNKTEMQQQEQYKKELTAQRQQN